MEAWQALVLGVVEGLTEFLPVSSTAHLILAERVLGLDDGVALQAFTVVIQGGAIVAVASVFWPRVKRMLAGLLGRDPFGLRLAFLLAIAFAPAAVAGVFLNRFVKSALFGLWPIVVAWLLGGLAIFCLPRLRRVAASGIELEALDARRAFAIGLFQCLALAPGTSRSLATIAGALLLGLSGAAAIEFSLLLGVLTLLAAAAHDALNSGEALLRDVGPAALAVGFAAASVSAWLAVKWLVAFVARRGLLVFGVYRVALALVVALALATGVLRAR